MYVKVDVTNPITPDSSATSTEDDDGAAAGGVLGPHNVDSLVMKVHNQNLATHMCADEGSFFKLCRGSPTCLLSSNVSPTFL